MFRNLSPLSLHFYTPKPLPPFPPHPPPSLYLNIRFCFLQNVKILDKEGNNHFLHHFSFSPLVPSYLSLITPLLPSPAIGWPTFFSSPPLPSSESPSLLFPLSSQGTCSEFVIFPKSTPCLGVSSWNLEDF